MAGLSSPDYRLRRTGRARQIALSPATLPAQRTDHAAYSLVVHGAQDGDRALSGSYLQPNRRELCYLDVWMDDLPARLATDLEGCFGDFVREHQDLVFGVALRVVRDGSSAEDVAQEAFVRAYRALKRYPEDRIKDLRARPWLARITLNLAKTHVRNRRNHDALDSVAETATAHTESPAQLVERRDERRMWARLLSALPDRYRLAVALRHVEELSYDELSAALDRPLGSVKSDVHRGVALLRAAYDAEQRSMRQKEAV